MKLVAVFSSSGSFKGNICDVFILQHLSLLLRVTKRNFAWEKFGLPFGHHLVRVVEVVINEAPGIWFCLPIAQGSDHLLAKAASDCGKSVCDDPVRKTFEVFALCSDS